MKETWIQSISGKRISLPMPKPEEIDIEDIAYSLSMRCRFNGHASQYYSIAEHSVRVSQLVETRLALGALLHDANEAYLPDIPRPVKDLIPEYKNIENLTQDAINDKFGIHLSEADYKAIKKADNIMLATEGKSLMGNTNGWFLPEPPMKIEIRPWTIKESQQRFLLMFNLLDNRDIE